MPSRERARQLDVSVAMPLALSLAPGSCTCAAMTIRSFGAVRAGNLGDERPLPAGRERAGDGHAHARPRPAALNRLSQRGRRARGGVALNPNP